MHLSFEAWYDKVVKSFALAGYSRKEVDKNKEELEKYYTNGFYPHEVIIKPKEIKKERRK